MKKQIKETNAKIHEDFVRSTERGSWETLVSTAKLYAKYFMNPHQTIIINPTGIELLDSMRAEPFIDVEESYNKINKSIFGEALKIICEKHVNLFELNNILINTLDYSDDEDELCGYNEMFSLGHKLSKKEFSTIKEVMKLLKMEE